MKDQSSCVKRVQQFASLFGVYFVHSINQNRVLSAIVLLQIYFFFYNTLFAFGCFENINRLFNFILHSIPIILPIFIELAINIEALKKVHLDQRIDQKFKELDEMFEVDSEVKFFSCAFAGKIFVLIVVRLLKMFYSGTYFSLSTMITELVLSTCEYKFVFDINLLGTYIKAYAQGARMKTPNESVEFRKHYLIFYKLSKLISRRYSCSMFLIITFNFITIVTCFYWVFIRIVHGPMR
jgi:hypothetical protein